MRGCNITFAILLLTLLNFLNVVNCATNEYDQLCGAFKDGTVIQKPGSCNEYINCQNATASVYTCVDSTSFDRNTQSCVDATDEKATIDNYCRNRCEGVDGKWVADPASCSDFYYCYNGEPLYGKCPSGYHFNELSQMCIYKTSECVYASSICELVPDKTTFRDETNCNKYYECSNSKLEQKTCKTAALYYDVAQGKCVDKKNVECSAHPIKADLCTKSGKPYVGPIADDATCNGYFYCMDLGLVPDLEPRWMKCPEGQFFHQTEYKCMDPINVPCEYNRCQGRGSGRIMVQSNNCYCHNYIICENNKEVETKDCYGDYFFDELTQSCTSKFIEYACCTNKKC